MSPDTFFRKWHFRIRAYASGPQVYDAPSDDGEPAALRLASDVSPGARAGRRPAKGTPAAA
ncbi:hypothetical protein GCM10022245_20920 [Streptomyces mayteni]